jgi:hypothetical protein
MDYVLFCRHNLSSIELVLKHWHLNLEFNPENRAYCALWQLYFAPVAYAALHFSCPCLLKAYEPAAFNTPFSHRRKASYRSAATLTHCRHLKQPPVDGTGQVFIKLMET